MRLLLIPDPVSPNGEDAFCREISRRAGARGHETLVQPVPNGPIEATRDRLLAAGFAAGCDAVLINSLQPAALLAAREAGKKTAVRLIDSYASASPQALAEVQKLALQADLLLVPSQHLAGVLKDWGGNGAVREVPYAHERIRAQEIALVTIRAARPNGFALVAFGPFHESARPGMETLLSAVARLRLDCHLSLIGDGPALPALRERAKQLMVAERVSFLGALPQAKALEYLRAAKAYVDACGLDGFPTMALYALSEGCPVIAVRSGAVEELIQDGRNGLLYNPGDAHSLSEAIVTLWSVRGLSLNLINDGINTVSNHSWDRTVSAVFDALESLG